MPWGACCPDDLEQAVIAGPIRDPVNPVIESRERRLLKPELGRSHTEATVEMLASDFTVLLDEVEIEVLVSATSPSKPLAFDRWRAALPAIGVACEDIGVDTALVGLAGKVSERVSVLLAADTPERREILPLLLKLWHADSQSMLGRAIEGASVLVDWEYELDAC